MKTALKISLFVFVSFLVFGGNADDVYKQITGNNLVKTVNYFASDELEGRLAGSKGYNKAANFVKNNFVEYGLKPVFNGSYFQEFNVEYNKINEPLVLDVIDTDNNSTGYKIGEDFICRGFTGSADLTTEVVYCGYGISAPELGYDDYADVDVKGKVVLVFKKNPKWKIDEKNWTSALPRHKAKVAADKGAIGLLMVSTTKDDKWDRMIGSVVSGEGVQDEDFPQVHVSHKVAANLFKGTAMSLKHMEKWTEETKQPHSFDLKNKVNLKINASFTKEKVTSNIAGMLKGNDPQLKDEYVIIGAHLDHVGKQGNIYFPGANDNASGSAAVMEIAKTFAVNNIKTDRSIIFVLFSAEESGLFGSQFMADNLPVKAEKVAAMLNMDCVGHGDSIRVGGGGTAPNLYKFAVENDEKFVKYKADVTWSGGGADAEAFFQLNIPTLYFVTKNSYTYLHVPEDTPETLDPEVFEATARLAFLTVKDAASKKYTKEEIVKKK